MAEPEPSLYPQVLDAEMMAAMDAKEDRSQALEATLQEKESQLEHLTELQKVCLPNMHV